MRRALAPALALLLPVSAFAAEIPKLTPLETPMTPPAAAAEPLPQIGAPGALPQLPPTVAAEVPAVFETPLVREAAKAAQPAARAAQARPAFEAFTGQNAQTSQAERAKNVIETFFEKSNLDRVAPPVQGGEPGKQGGVPLKTFAKGMAVAGAFVAAELVTGFASQSVSLRADSMHSAVDWIVNAVGLAAVMYARRRPDSKGWKKAEPAVGMASAVLVALTAYELGSLAVERFLSPVPVSGLMTAAFALFGVGSHLAPALAIGRHRKDGVGTEGIFMHAFTDAFASFFVALGGLASWGLGWKWIDPAVTAVIALLVAQTAFDLGRRSWRALKKPTASR